LVWVGLLLALVGLSMEPVLASVHGRGVVNLPAVPAPQRFVLDILQIPYYFFANLFILIIIILFLNHLGIDLLHPMPLSDRFLHLYEPTRPFHQLVTVFEQR